MHTHTSINNKHTLNGPTDMPQQTPTDNGKHITDTDGAHSLKIAPSGTFEKTSFDQLMKQYDVKHNLPPTLELTQAFLMTQNMKETAARVNGLTAGGSTYFLKNDFVGDSERLSDAMQSVSRLVGNLGTSDKASNFLLEQKQLMRVQANENREIRDMIEQKIVDGLEYVRIKEQIAETKSRVKELLDEQFSSEEDLPLNGKKHESSDTQEDSEEALKNKRLQEKRIKTVIKQLRSDARQYLTLKDGTDYERMPLHKICHRLKLSQRYRKKRDSKAIYKGLVNTLELTAEQLKDELKVIQDKTKDIKVTKTELERQIKQYEQVTNLEKRLKNDVITQSVSELDCHPMNNKSFELQNILFSFCGIDLKGQPNRHKKSKDALFGKIKKLPQKSMLLQSYQDQGENKGSFTQNENNLTTQARKKNIELVKVIGLEPEHLFQTLDKYKVSIDKMPKFSNVFERAEPIIPGLGMTVAGSLITGSQAGQMNFARVDGRNVISLQFNPYEIEDDPQKRKIYEAAMKDIAEQREKIKAISKQAREKQDASNIKRAWLNIVKKDLPKAFKGYQKYKADLENNGKKQSQNCLKEVRKKGIKTQRLVKETQMRAKKLNREMLIFWKKRDKEMADIKRKKEKVEKEIKRKQEEEKEALLQKKRLEFIMKQSEIYAHFMSKKLGLGEEQNKQRQADLDEEQQDNYQRVDIDEKGAKSRVAQMINETVERVTKFDQETLNKKHAKIDFVNEDELEVDKFDNPDAQYSKDIQAPKCFLGHLKDYQLKGLRWLDNLYEQGINGILADEMGLGKTIQAISLLAHLYETKKVWGPFMIIVPVTTLHNWQNELAKFCPTLKVLPYFGNPEERKKLGRFLDPKNLYNPTMQVNVLLTSYNLIVNNSKDQQKLMRVKWHYMILDEAQAIKNNMSRRWKVLLQFNTRNRLLLTGTPIQNTMQELWALLHFIMPKLFDNHEQFQEWFSKDIEQHSQNQGEISKHQLKRLHLVLKPFMLRRLKKDVEQEIGPKVEYEQYCEMTHRQRVLYQRIKMKISTKDLFQLVDSKAKMENLMNLVMQFRKVCNHPELFERRVGRIPFSFRCLQTGMSLNPNLQSIPDIRVSMKNPISYEIPKLIYDECFLVSDNNTKTFRKLQPGIDIAFSEVSVETHMSLFNIFNTQSLHHNTFGILSLFASSNKISMGELSYLFVADPLIKQIALMHFYYKKLQKNIYTNIHNNENDTIEISYNSTGYTKNMPIDINVVNFVKRDECALLYREYRVIDYEDDLHILPPLITSDLNIYCNYTRELKKDLDIYVNKSTAEPIQIMSRSGTFNRFISSVINSAMHKKVMVGKDFKPKMEIALGKVGRDRSSFLTEDSGQSWKNKPPVGYNLLENGIIGDVILEKGAYPIELPHYKRLVTDCAKMQFLDKLLPVLHKQGHRCLIFCQMTRMLDILEDFISWRKYTYFRMDGSTSIPDRRYMVEEYQKNPDVFCFLLSTRAGGLGVNLTAADTVIFYDNDWNPTMDAQATDRAHRIGQVKTVSVYRIITKGTVEENIVRRAKQKQNVQSTVYGGSNLKADVFKPKDVVEMLLDEEEINTVKERGKFLKTKRVKKAFQKSDQPKEHPKKEEKKSNPEDSTPKKAALAEKQARKDELKKGGKKPATEKMPKAPVSLFSTVKKDSNQPFAISKPTSNAGGPFSVQKNPFQVTQVFKTSKDSDDAMIEDHGIDEFREQEEMEEYGEEIDEAEEKLLQLLAKEDDSDEDSSEGIAIQFADEDAGNDKETAKGKKGKASKAAVVDEDEDEDMMDDY